MLWNGSYGVCDARTTYREHSLQAIQKLRTRPYLQRHRKYEKHINPLLTPGNLPDKDVRVGAVTKAALSYLLEIIMLFRRLCHLLLIGLPLVAIIGWTFELSAFKSLMPGLTPMNPLTAICFVILAGAIYGLAPENRSWREGLGATTVLASAVLLLSATRLTGYLFGFDSGPDSWLFASALETTVPANRMALPTAAAFLLSALSCLTWRQPKLRSVSLGEVLALAVMLIGLFATISYVYSAVPLEGESATIPMALNTAVLFTLVGLLFLSHAPRQGVGALYRGSGLGTMISRKLMVAAFTVPLMLGVLRLEGQRRGLFPAEIGTALFVVAVIAVLSTVIWFCARTLNTIDDRRTQAEREQATQRRFLRDVIDTDPSLIAIRTVDGRHILANQSYAQALGVTPDELLGKTLAECDVASAGWLRVLDGDRNVPARGRTVRAQDEVEYADDSRRWLMTVKIPIQAAEGFDWHVLSISTDITKRLEAEREANEARDEALRSNLAKSEFLSRMSHELRTPLNSILGFAQLMEMRGLEERQLESVQQILKGGHHLLQLINEVLDISRIETGNLSISLEPVDVEAAVRQAMDLVKPLADERQITMDLHVEAESLFLQADRQRLIQVLLNLVSNAIKYNRPQGQVIIRLRTASDDEVGIEVSDTGGGIPEEGRERLFTPFDRIGAEGSTVQGTGLGLALSQRLAIAMGGQLILAASSPEGSTFQLTLSRTENPVALAEVNKGNGPVPVETPTGHTVLYIEDNTANIRLIEHVMESRPDVELLVAMTGSMGLQLAYDQRPDLILLDLHLPDLDGAEVLTLLKRYPELSTVPVVILSADATQRQIDRLLTLGADRYLSKPLDIRELLAALDSLLPPEKKVA
jgi:PAS domain S-box-containing protein